MKGNKILARRRAREVALQAGYLLDVEHVRDMDGALLIFEKFIRESEIPETEEIIGYARELAMGVIENNSEIDKMVRDNVTGWRPERMSITDRVAVRLALFEGVVAKKVDLPVAISEAIELSRLFGSEESARFVNGVLGRIIRAQE